MLRYALTIFSGAFLLFGVQPLMAKVILPWFGGGPAIWTTCMLFFQLLLLAGYAYAHLIVSRLTPRGQALLHIGLLAASLACLPIYPAEHWKPAGDEAPSGRILLLLMATVGLPYWLLSATGPLLQGWLARTDPGRSPYRLYSLSNIGSLLALVSYPFLVEPRLRLRAQTAIWSWSYVAFALCCGWCALQLMRRAPAAVAPAPAIEQAPAPGWIDRLLWLGLSACGSGLLLAVTNQLCLDVAAVPFLWVLPLSLYLLSFIVVFASERFYVRGLYLFALGLVCLLTLVILHKGVKVHLGKQIVVYSLLLLVGCMVCHGELARRKPHPSRLTGFYLMIAAGGAVGGLLVTLAAPRLLTGFFELHIGMATTALLALLAMFFDDQSPLARGRRWPVWIMLLALYGWLLYGLLQQGREGRENVLHAGRNFYGVLKVNEAYRGNLEHQYGLTHGRIRHGFQYVREERRRWPTTYYSKTSGVGLALLHHPRAARGGLRVGLIGLGTGTLASYGRKQDAYRFYEINPMVLRIARTWFSYLRDCPAEKSVALGDARIRLEREAPQGFDVLAVDAFSSDAIPLHLLTRESFQLYWRHLRRDGVLALHISNRFLDLRPVVRGLAADAGIPAWMVDEPEDDETGSFGSWWILVTRNQALLDQPKVKAAIEPFDDEVGKLIWTDDFCNLYQVLSKMEDTKE